MSGGGVEGDLDPAWAAVVELLVGLDHSSPSVSLVALGLPGTGWRGGDGAAQ